MDDLIIKNGLIIDGTGAPPFKGDVVVRGDEIVAVARNLEVSSNFRVTDANGLIVSPGFIDTHSHSDFSLILSPGAESALFQGVTTEVIGNCGLSAFPVSGKSRVQLQEYLRGIGYDSAFEIDWTDLEGYAAALGSQGLGINAAPLVGHGSIRIAVMGFEARGARQSELAAMKQLLEAALDQGALGLSTGLVYPPGINSPASELKTLCDLVADRGAVYTTHLRGDSLKAGPTLIESLEEALSIARQTGVRLHVSHAAPKFPNTGAVQTMIAMMQSARQNDVKVTCDAHPYLAAMTFLASLLPPWVFEGGLKKTHSRLTDPNERARVVKAVNTSFEHLDPEAFWPLNEIVMPDPKSELNRLRLDAIGRKTAMTPAEALVEILAQSGEKLFEVIVLQWIYSARETRELFGWDGSMVGADGATSSIDRNSGPLTIHPRSWGTFPKMIHDYCKKDHWFAIEQLIHRMTGLAAASLGLNGRGVIQPGKKADIIVFDLENFKDKATFANPHQYAEGIQSVWVNGTAVIDQGKRTDQRPGKVLRR
jgi:N-acyl-D-amino-acid deacylase